MTGMTQASRTLAAAAPAALQPRRQRLAGRWVPAMLTVFLASACAITPTLPEAAEFEARREGPLELRYFGATTLTISDGSETILVDGFFSRPDFSILLRSFLGADLIRPDEVRIDEGLRHIGDPQVSAILVAHAHHDHAMDTAHVLRRYPGARLLGSRSVHNVVLGQGLFDEDGRPLLDDDVEPIKDGDVYTVGQFEITVLDATHEHTVFGPGGEICAPLAPPAGLRDYRAGPSFAFHVAHPDGTVMIVPSVDLAAKPEVFKQHPAEVVLLGIGLLGRKEPWQMKAYWDAVVGGTNARTVHMIHWDNFMHPLPLAGEKMKSFWADDMRESGKYLCAFAEGDPSTTQDDVDLSLLPFLVPVPTPSFHVGNANTSFCPPVAPSVLRRLARRAADASTRPAARPPAPSRCAGALP